MLFLHLNYSRGWDCSRTPATWSDTCHGQDPDTAFSPFTILLYPLTWGLIAGVPHPEAQTHNHKMICLTQALAYIPGSVGLLWITVLTIFFFLLQVVSFATTLSQKTFIHVDASSAGKPPDTHPALRPQRQNSWQARTWPCLNRDSSPWVSALQTSFYMRIHNTPAPESHV